jgi:hypothetical protein
VRRGRIQGKVWEQTAYPCHERWNGDRCKRPKGHTEHVPSKNPELEKLNGWHQNRSGCWKDGVFMTWPEFEKFRQAIYQAV